MSSALWPTLLLATAAAAGRNSSFEAIAEAARARCDADPDAPVESAQIAAYDGLRVNCHPPQGAPPCISEAFMHSKSKRSLNWLGAGGGPRDFGVCKLRRDYEDWPTAEPHHPPGARPGDGVTKSADDIAALIGPERRVLIIGASTARQLHDATLCRLASTPGGNFSALSDQFAFRWSNKYREAAGGCTAQAAADACARRSLQPEARSPVCRGHMLTDGCYKNGTAFGAALDRYDVVIAAYDPQHYGGANILLRQWAADMAALLLELARWRQRHAADPGRAAFVREGSSMHFVGGTYKQPPKFSGAGTAGSSCLCAHAEQSWAHRNGAWQATVELNALAARSGGVHVLPFYNQTLPRDDMHKGDMCSYRMKRVDGVPVPERAGAGAAAAAANATAGAAGAERAGEGEVARQHRRLAVHPIRACCDCLHMCYSPQFYDATFYTPIWHSLVRHHAYTASRGDAGVLP